MISKYKDVLVDELTPDEDIFAPDEAIIDTGAMTNVWGLCEYWSISDNIGSHKSCKWIETWNIWAVYGHMKGKSPNDEDIVTNKAH